MSFQNGGIAYNKLVYTLNSTNYTFIGNGNVSDGNGTSSGTSLSPPTTDPTLVIPSVDDAGNTVIGIMAGAFRNCTNLQKLVLPSTIRYIGVTNVNSGVVTIDQTSSAKGSFEGCTGLVHIKLSENSLFTNIPPNSFKDCKRLAAIRIPPNVTHIGSNAFSNGLFLKDVMICGNPDISKSYVSGSYTNGVFGNTANDSPANQNIYSTQQWKNNYFNIEYHSYWDNSSASSNGFNIDSGHIAKWHLYDPSAYLKVPAFQDFGTYNDTTFYPAGTGSVDNVNLDEDIQTLSNATANQKAKRKQIHKIITVGTGAAQRIYAVGHQTVNVSGQEKNRVIVMRYLMNGNTDTDFGDSVDSNNANSTRTGTLTVSLNDGGAQNANSAFRYEGAGNYETQNFGHTAQDIIEIPSSKNLRSSGGNQPASLIAICGSIGMPFNSTTAPNVDGSIYTTVESGSKSASSTIGFVALIDCTSYGSLWSGTGTDGWGFQWNNSGTITRTGFLTYRQDHNKVDYQTDFFKYGTGNSGLEIEKGINTDASGNNNLLTLSSGYNNMGLDVSHTAFRTDFDPSATVFTMRKLYVPEVILYNLHLAPEYSSAGTITQYNLLVAGTTNVYKMEKWTSEGNGSPLIRMLPYSKTETETNKRDALLLFNITYSSSDSVNSVLIRKINYESHGSSYFNSDNTEQSNWGNGWDYNGSAYSTAVTDSNFNTYYPDQDTSLCILHHDSIGKNTIISALDPNSPSPDATSTGANKTIHSRHSIHVGFNLQYGKLVADSPASTGFFPRIETFYLDNSGAPRSFIHYAKRANSLGSQKYLPSIQRQSLYQQSTFGPSDALRYNEYLLKSMVMCEGTDISSGVKRLLLCESGEGYPINSTKTTTGLVNIGSIDISHNTTSSGTHPEDTYNEFVFGTRSGFIMKSGDAFTNNESGGNKEWHAASKSSPDQATTTQSRDYYYALDGASPGNSHVQAAILDSSTGLRYLNVFTGRYTSATNIDIHMNKIPVQRKTPALSSENPDQTSSTYIPSGYPTITDLSSSANDNIGSAVMDINSKIYVGGYLSSLMGNAGANTHPFLYSLQSTKSTDIKLPFTFQFNITTTENDDISNNRANTHTYKGSNGFAYSGKAQSTGANLPIYNAFAQDTMKFTNITRTLNGSVLSFSVEGFALPDILHSNDGFIINTEQKLHESKYSGQGDRHRSVAGGFDDFGGDTNFQNQAKIDFTNVNLKVTKWGKIPFSKGWHGYALRKSSSAHSNDLIADGNTHIHGIFDEGFKNTSTGSVVAVTGGSSVATGNKNQDKPAILANTCWDYAWQSGKNGTHNATDNSFCNPPIDMQYWDISNVTTLRCAFKNTKHSGCAVDGTTGYLTNWNTSNVTDMWGTFYEATTFNQDISAWNTSNVTDMAHMFNGATAYNNNSIGPINWNCAKVTNMPYMYKGAAAFNQNIGSWVVSNVLSFNNMLAGATAFNVGGGTLTYWDVKKATDFTSMFSGASAFTDGLIQYWKIDSTDTITDIVANVNGGISPSIAILSQFSAYNQTRPVHYVNTDVSASNIVNYGAGNNAMPLGADTIIFGKNVTSVNNNSGLTGVRMIIFEPNQTNSQTKSVVTIQSKAFENCTNLETVILPIYHSGTHSANTTDNPLATDGAEIFSGCSKLKNIIHSVLYYQYGATGMALDGPPKMFKNTSLNDPSANIILAAGWYMGQDGSHNLAYHGTATISPQPMGTKYFKYTPNSSDASTILTNDAFQLTGAYWTYNETTAEWAINGTKFASLTNKLTEDEVIALHPDFTSANLLRAGYYGLNSYICFLTGTKIKTDQGYLAIETLSRKRHTIDGHKIKVITTTTYERNKLVCIKKDALFKNCPCEDTYLTGDHRILYKGKMTKAEDIVNKKSIVFVNMTKPVVYNIALEKEGEGKLVANNLIAETLDPENVLVYLYLFIEDKYVSNNYKMNAKRLFSLIMESETREERGRLIKQLFSVFKEAKKQNTKAPVAPKIFKL
jgi:surface protein